jgi:purine-binding chemotaxis protein CheW
MKEEEYFTAAAIRENLMLTFLLNGEPFAAETIYIKEIVEYIHTAQVPGTAEYIKGLINLRGIIVPVVDLAKKFDLGTSSGNELSIIILEHMDRRLGFLTERVLRLIQPHEGEMNLANFDVSEKFSFSNIKGMINMPQQSFFILDIEELFNDIFSE